jgi:hypothetical protein
MTKYDVTIRAIITKTYTVEADTEHEAISIAHEIFTVHADDTPEKFEQDVLSIKKAEGK